jgi:hypothetical protein
MPTIFHPMENANQARLRELTKRTAVETDHDKFAALIEELNRLADGDQPPSRTLPLVYDKS